MRALAVRLPTSGLILEVAAPQLAAVTQGGTQAGCLTARGEDCVAAEV